MNKDKLRILVVDDEVYVRLIIRAYFAPFKVEIIEARNGKEALDILKDTAIDLMVLDYVMPILTGSEVLEHILADPYLVKIPVVVYTAGGFDKSMEEWIKKSSAAFIEKSNLGEDLIPTVRDIMGDRLIRKN